MIVARKPEDIPRQPNSIVTVGTFDGVHRAHQAIIQELVDDARARQARSVVVTFHPHPKTVVASAKGPVQLLSTLEERIAVFESLGVDLLAIIPFTKEFAAQSPDEFVMRYLVGMIGVSEVVVGYDHMFGRGRTAGAGELSRLGAQFGFTVRTVPALIIEGAPVSSTRIRRALVAGRVEEAATLLGRPFRLEGTVVTGDRRGRKLGYPTANIQPSAREKIVPGYGIYVAGVEAGNFRGHGMMSIGTRPTVSPGGAETIEVHIFDFAEEIYGKEIAVTFLKRLRDEQRFESLEELTKHMDADREASLAYIRAHS